MRDVDLDTFLTDSAGDGEAEEESAPMGAGPPGTAGDGNGEPDEPEEPKTTPSTEPVEPIYDCTPGGSACASCGRVVARRWRDGSRMCCAACTEW